MTQRWLARLFVVALHAALLAALLLHRPARLPDTGDRRLTTVRIIPPTPDRKQPPKQPTFDWAPPPIRDFFPEPPTPSTTVTQPAPATEDAPPARVTTAPAEPPRTTLRLTLPPGYAASTASRNPALTDPRSNTPRATLEDKIADATGGAGAWVEERVENHSQSIGALGEYRTVMRRGNTCVEIFRSRISDNNAFNSSVAPSTIAMVGKSYPCK